MELARGINDKLKRLPLAVRVHAYFRLASFPFTSLIKIVPDKGKLLDVGCGFGLFIYWLKSSVHYREVIGYDPSNYKTYVAKILLAKFPKTSVTSFFPGGKFSVVTVIDVLYLLTPQMRVLLLSEIYKRLISKGTLIIAFVPKEFSWRYFLAWAQEWIMVRGIKKTMTVSTIDFETEDWMQKTLAQLGFSRLRKYELPTPWPFFHRHVVYMVQKN